jgi:hypothetical protein
MIHATLLRRVPQLERSQSCRELRNVSHSSRKHMPSFLMPLQLENLDDLDQPRAKEVSPSTLRQYQSAKRWFIEFLKWQYPDQLADRYFNRDHPAPDAALLKNYTIFIAQSRVGYINTSISVATLTNYIRLLLAILGTNRRRRLERELYADVLNYINNALILEYSVPRDKWNKPVAHSEDLSYLLQVLFSASFIATLPNMRQALKLHHLPQHARRLGRPRR